MSQPIKITHVIYRLAMGGMENGLINLVNGMDRRFVHQIISLTDVTDFSSRITNQTVQIEALHKKPGKDLGVYLRLYRLLRKFQPDIVHTRNFGTVDCGLIAKVARSKVLIHSEHGWDMADLDGNNKKYMRLRRLLSPLAQVYLAVSADIKNWLQREVRIAPKKLLHIYNGVDTQRFYPGKPGASSELNVGFVGRLEAVKNPQSLLKAMRHLSTKNGLTRAVKLHIVGDGSLSDELQDLGQSWGLDQQVSFLGARSDIADLMRSFDVFVLPSLNEGISNTILEAMASGLPVVACRVGGNPELVEDGKNGVLYPSDDVEALAQALEKYANNEQLRASHGAWSTKRVDEKFSLSKMVGSYEQMYQSALTTT